MIKQDVGAAWQRSIETDDVDAVRELLKHPYGNMRIQCLKKHRVDGTWFLLDPLCAAAKRDCIPVARLLIEAGTNPNEVNGLEQGNELSQGAHCLAWAASEEMRRFLLGQGADPATIEGVEIPHLDDDTVSADETNDNLGEQWQAALETLDADRVADLLSKHPRLIDQAMLDQSGDGRFWRLDPLYQVASANDEQSSGNGRNDNLELVKLLVEAGYADQKVRRAVREATPAIAAYLLEKCPDADAPDLARLAYDGRSKELQFWFDRGRTVTSGALHNATCGRGRHRGFETDDHGGWPEVFRDTVRVLIAAGADVNERNATGGAAYDGCKPYVTNGETPLHFAAASWDVDVIEQLLHAGADRTLENKLSETAYDWAVKWAASDEVQALLRIGGDKTSESKERKPQTESHRPSAQMTKPDGTPDDAWQLICAAVDGEPETARQLLESKPELNHYQMWYEFPIHFAVRAGHADVVQLLMDAGANPARSNFTYSSWQKLLPMAKEREREDIHQILVAEMQRRFNYSPEYQPLWRAIGENDVDAVRRMIQEDSRLVQIADEHGNRAIHWAVLSRRLPIVELLLNGGADINARRADLQTSLHVSVVGDYWFGANNRDPDTNSSAVTEFLLAHGADYEFTVAVARGDVEWVNAALEKEPKLAQQLNASHRSPLYHAARMGRIEIARRLLELKADPNLPEECADRGRALFEASSRNDLPMMTLLLKHGADPNAEVDSSGNCLSIAEHDNDDASKAIALLKQYGAKDGQWRLDTPEKVAARLADDESLDPIGDLWSGVINAVLKLDRVELLDQFIARFGTAPIRKLNPTNGWRIPASESMLVELLRHGMNINARDWYGKSFLHHVTRDESTERAGWLIAHGIEINAIDHQSGTTALGIAASAGNLGMVDFLLNRGADPSLPRDADWAQPVAFAAKQGHSEVANRLRSV